MIKINNIGILLVALINTANSYAASSDEIQVYDDSINQPGELNVDNHINYVPEGIKEKARYQEVPAHHNFRFTPEFAYGLTKNWEAGFYIPTIRFGNGDWYIEGAKVRLKYIADHAEHGFYWGINQELAKTTYRTDDVPWNYELRCILGYKIGSWNLVTNPIFGFALSGHSHTPKFTPDFRVVNQISEKVALGIEQYMDLGPINQLRSHVQETYLTIDTVILKNAVQFGIGHGWTKESNDTTVKVIYNIPL